LNVISAATPRIRKDTQIEKSNTKNRARHVQPLGNTLQNEDVITHIQRLVVEVDRSGARDVEFTLNHNNRSVDDRSRQQESRGELIGLPLNPFQFTPARCPDKSKLGSRINKLRCIARN
jgi:hypothetical protein